MNSATRKLLNAAIETETKLSAARVQAIKLEAQAEKHLDEIEKAVDLRLYQNSIKSSAVFWRQELGRQHRDSVEYADTIAAYQALLDNNITWK